MPTRRADTDPSRASAEVLLARFLSEGSPEALAHLFDETAASLLRTATEIVGSVDMAEDLVQETFLVLLDAPVDYDPCRPALPYLTGILRRKALALLKQRKTHARHERLRGVDREESDGFSVVTAREGLQLVKAAVQELPEPYREVVAPYIDEHVPPRVIAGRLGLEPGAVRVRLHRGLHVLRQALPRQWRGLLLVALAANLATRPVGAMQPRASRRRLPRVGRALLIAAGMLGVTIVAMRAGATDVTARGTPAVPVSVPIAAAGSEVRQQPVPLPARRVTPESAHAVTLTWIDTGEPAEQVGAMVFAPGERYALDGLRLRTDRRGRLALAGLAPGRYEIRVDRGVCGRVVVPESGRLKMAVRLPAALTVVGRVIDRWERPVDGARLWLGTPWSNRHGGHVVGKAGSDGRFELRGIRPGSVVGAWTPAGEPTSVFRIEGREPILLRVILDNAPMDGLVVDADEAPLAGAKVFIGLAGAGIMPATTPVVGLITGVDGRFRVEHLPKKQLTAVVHRRGFASISVQFDPSKADRLRLEMSPGRSLRGRVIDSRGEPVALARVTARTMTWTTSLSTMTDAAGRFLFDSVGPEVKCLCVEANGHSRLEIRVPSPAVEPSEMQIRVGGPASKANHGNGLLQFRFFVPDTEITPQVTAWLTSADLPKVDLVGAQGTQELPAGEYRLQLSGRGVSSVSEHPVVVRAGERAAVEIPLRPGRAHTLVYRIPTAIAPSRVSTRIVSGDGRSIDLVSSSRTRPGAMVRVVVVLTAGWHAFELTQGHHKYGTQFFVGASVGRIDLTLRRK